VGTYRAEEGGLGEGAADEVAEGDVDALRMALARQRDTLQNLGRLGGDRSQEESEQGRADLLVVRDLPCEQKANVALAPVWLPRAGTRTCKAEAVATTDWMKGLEKRKIMTPPTHR
jgi:hypothetical protein